MSIAILMFIGIYMFIDIRSHHYMRDIHHTRYAHQPCSAPPCPSLPRPAPACTALT